MLTSDEDTYMLLWEWDSDVQDFVFVDSNDDLATGNTNSRIEWTPVDGRTYLLDLTTYTANTLGDFTLNIGESSSSAQSSSSEQRMEHPDIQGGVPFERRP